MPEVLFYYRQYGDSAININQDSLILECAPLVPDSVIISLSLGPEPFLIRESCL